VRVEDNHSREFIPFSALDDSIEYKYIPIGLRLKDEDVLIKRLFDVQDPVDLESHRLTRPLRRYLSEPAIWGKE
jgi:hypothetical protein